MKLLRKITQGIAVFALCGALLCGNAFADVDTQSGGPFPDVSADADYAEAVATLVDMGILKGDEAGNFNPDKPISRAEAATIICRMLGVENEAKQIKTAVFTDVPSSHWAVGYTAKAAELGIINGYGNGKFGPSNPVTYEQMVKMLVCAWGYVDDAVLSGGWPNGYIAVAKDIRIIDNNSSASNNAAPIPRWMVAQLSYNTAMLPTNYEGGSIDESF